MDGIETARRLRADAGPAGVPRLVMTTAFGQDEVRSLATEAGIEAFLLKPVSQSTLADTLFDLFADANAPAQSRPDDTTGSMTGLRLLLVEDNEINQQIAMELLRDAGAEVQLADNGKKAVDLLMAAGPAAFHAVLMDLQMPVMGGLEATRLIRADARFAPLPIIAMTAHAMREERERCMAAGMVDHVSKPLDPDSMLLTVARWARSHTAASVAPAPTSTQASAVANGTTGDQSPISSVALATVPGLDSTVGLRRVAGNHALYLRLLGHFMRHHSEAPQQLTTALERGDQDAALRLAHTIKGVAGNVGLVPLAAAAAALEDMLRQGHGPTTEQAAALSRFAAVNAAAVEGLRQALAPPIDRPLATEDLAQAQAKPAVTAQEAAASLAALAQLLGDNDSDAVEFLETQATALRAAMAHETFGALETAVQQFDFEAALQIIQPLLKA